MTSGDLVLILGAMTALLVAVSGVLVQVRQTHSLVNSRMTELLDLTRRVAKAEATVELAEGSHPLGAIPPHR